MKDFPKPRSIFLHTPSPCLLRTLFVSASLRFRRKANKLRSRYEGDAKMNIIAGKKIGKQIFRTKSSLPYLHHYQLSFQHTRCFGIASFRSIYKMDMIFIQAANIAGHNRFFTYI